MPKIYYPKGETKLNHSFKIRGKTVKVLSKVTLSKLPSVERRKAIMNYGTGKFKYYFTVSGNRRILNADNLTHLKNKLIKYWTGFS